MFSNVLRSDKKADLRGKGSWMPKRVGNLYQNLSDRAFVKAVLINACKDRPDRKDVERVKKHIDEKTEELCRLLETGAFRPRRPNVSYKFDASSQKLRTIRTVPFFPDCCVQWLIVELLRDKVLMRGMDPYCCASIPGRGGIRVYNKLKLHIAAKYKQAKYSLQCDVHHYYDNIRIDILMQKLQRRCKDEKLLSLIESILRISAAGEDGNTGLAIGFYLNQWLANFYLESIDRKIRESGLASCFVRYMDNITIIGGNKRKLRKLRALISEWLAEICLELKGDWQVFPLSKRSVNSVGYRFYSTGNIALRKRSWKIARRQFIRVARKIRNKEYIPARMARGFMSRFGNLKHLQSSRLVFRKYISEIDFASVRRAAV